MGGGAGGGGLPPDKQPGHDGSGEAEGEDCSGPLLQQRREEDSNTTSPFMHQASDKDRKGGLDKVVRHICRISASCLEKLIKTI